MATSSDMLDDPMPSHDQIKLLFELINNGVIDKHELQIFLDRSQNGTQSQNNDPFENLGPLAENFYSITVDYDLTLGEMIRAGGYDSVSDNITPAHFPIHIPDTHRTYTRVNSRIYQIIQLIHYEQQTMRSEAVLSDLASRHLRPATLPELLALGVRYPDVQRQCLVVALGSVWYSADERFVPCLTGSLQKRRVFLSCRDRDWSNAWYFAAM